MIPGGVDLIHEKSGQGGPPVIKNGDPLLVQVLFQCVAIVWKSVADASPLMVWLEKVVQEFHACSVCFP